MTTPQFIDRSKDVTRRFGWWFLKPDDQVMGCKKCMGLPKGEKIERLGLIEIVTTKPEPLNLITPDEVRREGFPDWSPEQFIQMLVDHYNVDPRKICNRIEYRYL